MTRITLAILIASQAVTAHAGGVLLCNQFGCRSAPYLAPPIVTARPPVVYVAPNPPPLQAPGNAYNNPPVRPPPPADVAGPTAEQQEIESGILAFCRDHATEPFCGKLTDYLARRSGR